MWPCVMILPVLPPQPHPHPTKRYRCCQSVSFQPTYLPPSLLSCYVLFSCIMNNLIIKLFSYIVLYTHFPAPFLFSPTSLLDKLLCAKFTVFLLIILHYFVQHNIHICHSRIEDCNIYIHTYYIRYKKILAFFTDC